MLREGLLQGLVCLRQPLSGASRHRALPFLVGEKVVQDWQCRGKARFRDRFACASLFPEHPGIEHCQSSWEGRWYRTGSAAGLLASGTGLLAPASFRRIQASSTASPRGGEGGTGLLSNFTHPCHLDGDTPPLTGQSAGYRSPQYPLCSCHNHPQHVSRFLYLTRQEITISLCLCAVKS